MQANTFGDVENEKNLLGKIYILFWIFICLPSEALPVSRHRRSLTLVCLGCRRNLSCARFKISINQYRGRLTICQINFHLPHICYFVVSNLKRELSFVFLPKFSAKYYLNTRLYFKEGKSLAILFLLIFFSFVAWTRNSPPPPLPK